ncbi:MAG: metal-dependent hydrolase [Acidimicrobiales bacterium]|nr:metal-dependent hydrolase [Acidimicrobiales bacterium]
MFFWFAGCAFAAVWLVFRSPALDHRVVMVGAVLPLAELLVGRPTVLHTLLGASAAMTVVMALTRRRRLLRRRWLGIPVGLYAHLVLDATWTDQHLFWWPFFGAGFQDRGLPELRPWPVVVIQELIGLAAIWWMVRSFSLDEPERRDAFLRTGQLGRDLVA